MYDLYRAYDCCGRVLQASRFCCPLALEQSLHSILWKEMAIICVYGLYGSYNYLWPCAPGLKIHLSKSVRRIHVVFHLQQPLKKAFGACWKERIGIIYAGDDTTDEDSISKLKGKKRSYWELRNIAKSII